MVWYEPELWIKMIDFGKNLIDYFWAITFVSVLLKLKMLSSYEY